MISSGVEIIPTFELKNRNSVFNSLPIILYGKTSSGPGYAKIGLDLNYWNAMDDLDVGINFGFGISRKISDSMAIEAGIEITPYFKVIDIYLPVALRLGVVF